MIERPTLDKYFLKIASVVAERSTCLRRQIGAIAVRDKRVLSTGYNGSPAGLEDCLQLGCLRDALKIPSGKQHETCRSVHAEQNVIIQAATHGVDITGSTIYATDSPCRICAKMLVNAKIVKYICSKRYDDESFEDIFEEAGIMFEVQKLIVVAVSGHFDPYPHAGHIEHISEASKLGDRVVVMVNTDRDCRNKHNGKCYTPAVDRMRQIVGLKHVDYAILTMDEDGTQSKTLRFIKPDIFAKGGDRTVDNMPEGELDACNEIGCKIVYGVGAKMDSSSSIIEKIRTKD